MSRRVVFGRRALEDLREMGAWIASHADDTVAERYLNRLRSYRERFDIFPERAGRVVTTFARACARSVSSAA